MTRWIPALLLAACTAPNAGAAGGTVHRVGLLGITLKPAEMCAPEATHPAPKLLREGLRARGWREGDNLVFHCRSIEGDASRYPTEVGHLLAVPVDVIVTYGNRAAHEVRRASPTVPIVMATSGNPVEDGLVQSLARPGGRITGLTLDAGTLLYPKRLALLRETAPAVRNVATLSWTQSVSGRLAPARHPIWEVAEGFGMVLSPIAVDSAEALPHVIEAAVASGAQALLVADESPFHRPENQAAIHRAAERHRIPVVHAILSAAETGGLMAYGTRIEHNYLRAAHFVDRVLRGVDPGSIPIEQPAAFELWLNRKAARAIGLSIPQPVLARADRVIE